MPSAVRSIRSSGAPLTRSLDVACAELETHVDLAVDTMMAQELTGARTKCVLLAEDDPYMRQLLASALRKDGYEVIEAKDGVECLGCMQSWVFDHAAPTLPDIIISDIRMPGWSGLE